MRRKLCDGRRSYKSASDAARVVGRKARTAYGFKLAAEKCAKGDHWHLKARRP